MRSLKAVATYFLSLCVDILLAILILGINTLPAHAKLGPISIRSVYTTDENQNNKIVFMPGDWINYHVDVDNTTGSPFPIDVRVQAFANDYSPDPSLYHYDLTYHVDQMPVGLSRFYTPIILPSNAPSYFYAVRITITPSGCFGTGCTDSGDWGEKTFTIQMTKAPEGKAPNLIVLVHGCCTDANGVGVLGEVANEIGKRIDKTKWEIVVWDWHEYTPTHDYPKTGIELGVLAAITLIINDANTAYENAWHQGAVLADAIKIHPYEHVHLIGHSAGANLIHEAATAYIGDYFIRQKNPFMHLTFLDAYTPGESANSYGSLPAGYQNYYSEHYVDRGLLSTDACLPYAFNFDITSWKDKDDRLFEFGHQWPHRWYKESVTSAEFKYGFPLSFEDNYDRFSVAKNYPPGQQCSLLNVTTECAKASCW